ncbi:hypothetical protein E2C01_012096 [Portunus trituberculatus]|uniref:Uncharacterized protein n=1 Tax=Portunus trituberculatus TaxID=210409 RepID=A0A5B7DDL6_PORTR|nr:hypothetical protein [Portunus trituberculatus]
MNSPGSAGQVSSTSVCTVLCCSGSRTVVYDVYDRPLHFPPLGPSLLQVHSLLRRRAQSVVTLTHSAASSDLLSKLRHFSTHAHRVASQSVFALLSNNS